MRSERCLLLILALPALLLFPAGCGEDSGESLQQEWADFLAGTWQLRSMSFQGQSTACPGQIEIGEGEYVECGEMTAIFRLQGTFRMDAYNQTYLRMEGTWRVAGNQLLLEATESGTSDTGPVEDADMEALEPPLPLAFILQRFGDLLGLTDAGTGVPFTVVPVTAVFERA